MAGYKGGSVPLELRTTAQLLLDTEQKIEKLQAQIDAIDKKGAPEPALKPEGASPANPQNSPRHKLVNEQETLKRKTLGIVNSIEESSKGDIQQSVKNLKKEWLIDMEPAKDGEDPKLRKQMRDMGRMRSEVWRSVKGTEELRTDFQKYADEMTGHKPDVVIEKPSELQEAVFETTSKSASLMDKARGLQDEYSYLDDNTGKDETKETIEKDDPNDPDIEPKDP